MKAKVLCCSAAALLLIISAPNLSAGEGNNSRAKLRNSTGIELLGNSLLYSFYYSTHGQPLIWLRCGLGDVWRRQQ